MLKVVQQIKILFILYMRFFSYERKEELAELFLNSNIRDLQHCDAIFRKQAFRDPRTEGSEPGGCQIQDFGIPYIEATFISFRNSVSLIIIKK